MACECGENKCGGTCGCNDGFSSEGIQRAEFEASTYPGYKAATGSNGCVSTKGKLFDLLLEDFVVPEVGREAYIRVCDGSRWKAQQFVGIALSGSKMAAFKITEVGQSKLKVLNGCDKSGDNPILGNPEKGVTIPAKSVLYPVPPVGCDSGFALDVLTVLTTKGTDAILEILSESENICFTSVPNAGEDEEVHLFGGTKPDCDCAPDASISSCLRKIIKIFTGQGGRTLCMPEVASVTFSGEKRVAVFDESDCLKKGPTYEDLLNCSTDEQLDDDGQANSIMACADGVRSGFEAWDKNISLTTVQVDDPDSDDPDDKITVWKTVEKRFALIQDSKGAGAGGGAGIAGAWTKRELTTIQKQSTGFVSLSSNEITINKPGLYKIDFSGVFYAPNDFQLRLENVDDGAELYYSNSGYGEYTTAASNTLAIGHAIVEVLTTKKFKLMYYLQTTGAGNRLGFPNAWGPNVYANVCITAL